MRSIATRQLMSFSWPLARRQSSLAHTSRDSAARERLGSAAMSARIACNSCALNSRPQ